MKTDKETVIQCGRTVSRQEIDQIRETVNLFPQLSRSELYQTICEHLQWHTASGSNKITACSKLLKKLELWGCFQLPQKKGKKRSKPKVSISFSSKTRSGPEISGSLSILGKISLEVIKDKKEIRLWKEYMSRYHYLGETRPFGFFLRYFIRSERGLLGCALFSGAAKSIGVRDQWIGWTPNQRLRNLSWLINNTRFLIFPWVNVRYLASHVLGLAASHIKDDWHEKWGYHPVLMETFVDGNHYRGTCYKAANWEYIGTTTGIGLARKSRTYKTTPKKIFIKPLTKDFREKLCSDKLVGRAEI